MDQKRNISTKFKARSVWYTFFFLSGPHNSESYRLIRFGVGLFDGRFGVGFGVAFPIYPESESESRVA